jgi:hypothetical protein
MKRALLLACILSLLSGCKLFAPKSYLDSHYYWRDYYVYNYDDAEITLKNGKACFAPVNVWRLSKEEAPVSFVRVFWGSKEAWGAKWDEGISLSGDECIPYGGASPLEKDTFYLLSLSAFVEWPKPGVHVYSAVFCLSEDKNGETVVQRFPLKEFPSTCPAPEVK